MPLPVNEARGEVAVTVNGVDLVVAAEMERLAHLSSDIGAKTLHELYQRVTGAELAAMYAVLRTCVVRGNASEAGKAIQMNGAVALASAMTRALAHHAGTDAGNAESARTKSKKPSPGANG